MAKIRLKQTHLDVLREISVTGTILVSDLTERLKLDRGIIEGAIASLIDEGLIERKIHTKEMQVLTKRGKEAANGLTERIILDALLEKPIHIKDIGDSTGLQKGDITAGIGILKKAGIIQINKGIMEIADNKLATLFSKDLEDAIKQLGNGKTEISNKETVEALVSRGMIELQEQSIAEVTSKVTAKQLSSAQVVEEVSILTSKMIADESWKEATFKPYSLSTSPRRVYAGKVHPYREFLEQLKRKLVGLGFQEMKGPLVEMEYWNFDVLYAPQDHSAREDNDILLVTDPTHGTLPNAKHVKNVAKTHENGWKTGSLGHRYKWDPMKAARLLLRPQGTAISARTLVGLKPPIKYFSIARCYRPDQVDATHGIEFSQTEGIICDPDITFRDLLGMLETFARDVAGATKVHFRPDYYPFTSPSVELSAEHPVLGHIEFGGAGIFRPEVTQPFGIKEPVIAWGIGVERLFMTKYRISDIRELFSSNLEWLRNMQVSSGFGVDA